MECEIKAKIYLCRADCSLLGTITGIRPETCILTENATNLWELKFDVDRYINADGGLAQSDYYDSVDDMMRLYLDSDDIQAFFMIDAEPVISGNGSQETKSVTAHSIECELSYMQLKNFKINCGTPDSQEYLATDSKGNFNNINPYTGLPYEYIPLVNYGNEQLSLLHLVLQGTGWAVKDGINADVCGIKKSFDISGGSIYAFLMKTVSPAASVIFEFDRKNKTVGIVKAEDYGVDTGVFITMRNLMHSFEVTSTSGDGIMTKIVPSGANNLGIEYVNFGKDFIVNLDYFMNTLNEYGDYKYVSAQLHDKYNAWKNYRDTDAVTYNGKNYTRRGLYRELTKQYNKTLADISELRSRVPNDGCIIDYKTFPLKDLKVSLTAYNNALTALIMLYENEYGVAGIGSAPDYSPAPSGAVNIKNTPYWHDFYAYKEKIIPQVTEALKMYCQTDENGNLVKVNGNFIELESGNPAYYADNGIVKSIDSYLYEWSLYGLDELEAKKKAWSEAANLLFNECFIIGGTASAPTAYRTADDSGWNGLTAEQKKQFTSKASFIDKLNQYLDYMSFNGRTNSLTKTRCKGIIRQCEDSIVQRKAEISSLEKSLNAFDTQRRELAAAAAMENFRLNGSLAFTSEELSAVSGLLREMDYSNENIITTNLDDAASTVDMQEELYQAAVDELYKISQPQYAFRTELDNLYALDEFKAYREPFKVGNFIRLGLEIHEELYDNRFIKLRLISVSRNHLEDDEGLSVEFSTMAKTLNGMDDLDFLLDGGSASSGSSSSSSSSSGGTYGNNDANVQMSNKMINALLNTELFGAAVGDAVLDAIKANRGNFNTLFSHSGVFDSLESGKIKVSGDCLMDRIKSINWNGTEDKLLDNTAGSIIDLSTGQFSFAGGKLMFKDRALSVNGDIAAENLTANTSGTIAGWHFDKDGFYRTDQNGGRSMVIGKDGISAGGAFNVSKTGKCVIDDIDYLDIGNVDIRDNSIKVGETTSLSKDRLNIGNTAIWNGNIRTGGLYIGDGTYIQSGHIDLGNDVCLYDKGFEIGHTFIGDGSISVDGSLLTGERLEIGGIGGTCIQYDSLTLGKTRLTEDGLTVGGIWLGLKAGVTGVKNTVQADLFEGLARYADLAYSAHKLTRCAIINDVTLDVGCSESVLLRPSDMYYIIFSSACSASWLKDNDTLYSYCGADDSFRVSVLFCTGYADTV